MQSLTVNGMRSVGMWTMILTVVLAVAIQPATAQTTAPAAGSLPVATQPAGSQPTPIINVDNIEYDFGDFWAGPEAEHTFKISNRGSAPLQILGVKPDCGCTSAGQYPKSIEPGQSGDFPFKMKTAAFNGRIAPKKITILSNDPVTPQLVLRLLGTFKRRIDVSPRNASFGTIVTTDPVTKVLKIKNNTDQPLELKLPPVSSDQVKFELSETMAGKEFDLKVSTVVPYKPGVIQASASLQTNLPEEKTILVSAVGRVPERLDLYPVTANYIRPARVPPGQDHGSLYFWLNNYGASLVNVTEASVDDPAIKTTVDCRSPGKNFRIQVDVPFNAAIPPQGRTLTIKTDDSEKPVLQAKIMAPAAYNTQPSTARPPQQQVKPATLMVGKPVPAFNVKTFEGQSIAGTDLADKITILNFVSPACGFCKLQIPELEKIRESYQAKGVRFVNVVNPNPGGRRLYSDQEITDLMKTLKSNLETATDPDQQAGNAFQVSSYPTCMVIGKDAKVAAVDIGSKQVQLLPAQLDALLAGKPIPPPAPPPPGQPVQAPVPMPTGKPIIPATQPK